MKHTQGFTLIELMIVVAVIGILAAVAIPQYGQYVVRSNRTAAQAFMMDIANREKQYLLDARSYTSSWETDLKMAAPKEVAKNYTITISVGVATLPSFTITAAPIANSAQANANDGSLTLNDLGEKGPAGKW